MSFEEMSKQFQMAFGLTNPNSYDSAIKLYEQDLIDNPNNIAAMNNIAMCKINLSIIKQDKSLLPDAILLLKKAIDLVNGDNNYKYGYPIAEANLKWANDLLEK